MDDKELTQQQADFELWFTMLMRNKHSSGVLDKDKEKAYKDGYVNALFCGFCAGRITA